MSIQIGNYSFDGPFGDPAHLRNNSGVYAVLTRTTVNDKYTVVDIGEAGWVRDRIAGHDRQDQWARCRLAAGLSFAAFYCDERARMQIERELRVQFNPASGVR
jgi:hypothetical protein